MTSNMNPKINFDFTTHARGKGRNLKLQSTWPVAEQINVIYCICQKIKLKEVHWKRLAPWSQAFEWNV